MSRKKRINAKRVLSAVLSATMVFTSVGSYSVAAESGNATKVVRLDPTQASTFHDTNDDGLGEFEGFGTSLCWWANRIGYNEELTRLAGELFFNQEKGLGMSIGRYNIGGGDLVGEVKVAQAKPNPKAQIYDVVTDGYKPSYAGKNMQVNTVNFGETKFTGSDADFGFLEGNSVGSFKYVGWINKLDDSVGDGDNLKFSINAPEEGDYTVKILLTLTGTNSRDVALRVMNSADDTNAKLLLEEEESTTTEETTTMEDESSMEDSSSMEEETSTQTVAESEEDKDTTEETVDQEESSSIEDADIEALQEVEDSKESEATEETELSTVIYEKKNLSEKTILTKLLSREAQKEYTDYVVDSQTINDNQIANDGSNKLFVATIKNVKLQKGENIVFVAGQKDWTLDFIKMAVIKAGDEAKIEDLKAEDPGEELPEFFHGEHIIRSDSAVPGYCVNVTRMDTSKKTIAEYAEEFDRVDETSGFAWDYNWDADSRQMNVLKAAIENGGQDFLAEIFSNSPPYFMTVSGCSSGNVDASKDNLREDCYEAFAKYMADVMEYWHQNGIDFQSATPMNEPHTNYWAARSNKQEGCHFEAGESQSKIFVALDKELRNKGLDKVLISASDETSIDTAITSYNKLSDEAKNVVERIDTHTYSGSKRTELKNLALSAGKNLWMSEVDGSYTAGTGAGQMSAGLGLGQQIITDLNGLESSAWILWNAIDMHVDSSEAGKSWVEKGSNNDFLTTEALYRNWIPKENSGYWGLAAANHDTNEIYLTKKYYAYGQFSRYIRPGYTLIGSSNEGKVLTAYDPEGEKVVAVVLNTTDKDESWTFDLSLFNEVDKNAKVKAIRTSGSMEEGENWADVSENDDIVMNASEKSVSATVKANSITTYIISGVTYDPNNKVTDKLIPITITRDAIKGSEPWSGGTDCDVDKLIDNDFNTYFDGVTDGYVIVDLGAETELAAVAFAPRSGYTDRCVGAMIAGSNDAENWTKLFTITDKPSAGALTYIYSSQFDGTNNKFRYIKYYVEGEKGCCNIAELKFFTKEPTVASIQTVSVITEPGKVPQMPARVEGKTTTGETHSFVVEWKVDEAQFKNTKFLDQFTVEGNLVGNNLGVEATVIVAPKALEYFVDCNHNDSDEFKVISDNLEGLINTTNDQKKTSDNTWGYLEEYGQYNGNTSSDSGWYAKKNQNIEYTFQMPAGSHEVTLCGSGKWWNTSRNMEITYEVDGKETKLCTLKTEKGKEITATGKMELTKAAEVKIRVKKASGESQDPVLSWIAIEGPVHYAEGIVYTDGTVKIAESTEEGKVIAWDTKDYEVSADLFKYQEITGTIDGKTPAKGKVLVIPEELEYFIDCNNADSAQWNLIKDSENLKNKDSADQKKTKDNLWGRNADYGLYNDTSSSAAGGYYSKTPIEYVLPMTAGVHNLYACANGYWWSQWTSSRAMDITYEVDGVEKPLFTLKTQKDKEVIGTGKIILSKDANIIIRVKKATGEKEDSIISWLAVSNNSVLNFTGTKGDQMYDIDGNRIQAHGGQIQKIGDTWYWIGEDKTYGYQPCPGIHMYSSKDLYNWKDEGVVLKTMTSYEQFETDEYFKTLYGDLSADEKKLIYTDLAQGDATSGYKTVIERPKMLYNEKTDKYVIWFHADGKSPYESGGESNYSKAKAGIAIADSPTGPYTLLGSYLLASGTDDHGFDSSVGGHVRDMNLFKDDDGTAYVLYSSEGNAVMYIAKLNDSYTGLVKDADKMELGKDFVISSTDSREAPAMFKYENKYYLITSGCTGWSPNQARYAVADSPLGPWKNMGDPCVGDSTNLTFSTQSTCVIPVDPEAGKYIYMGDRWFSDRLEDSRYVWLPIEFGSDSTIMIRDYSDWTLEDLNNKGSIKVTDTLPKEANSINELLAAMPETVSYVSGGQAATSEVTWKVSDAALALDKEFIGEVQITGTLKEANRDVYCKALVSPKNLVYFADCFTNTDDNTSKMHQSVANRSEYLMNTVSDQTFAKDPKIESQWGYISVPGASGSGSTEDMGSKGVGDFYDTGWWATSAGSIAYAFTLKPGKYTVAAGFNEWWSATREMTIDVISKDSDGAETVIGSTSFTMKNDKALEKVVRDVEVPENSVQVVVKVSKKSGGDPIVSWFGIIAENPDKPVTSNDNKNPGNNGGSSTDNTSSDNSTDSTTSSNNSEQKQNTIQKVVDIIEDQVAKVEIPVIQPVIDKIMNKPIKRNETTVVQGESTNSSESLTEADVQSSETTNEEAEVTPAETETPVEQAQDTKEETVIEETITPTTNKPAKKNPVATAAAAAAATAGIVGVGAGATVAVKRIRIRRKK